MSVEILRCSPIYHPMPVFSWLIKFFSKTNYSHFAIKCGDKVLDATSKRVRLHEYGNFISDYKIVGKNTINSPVSEQVFLAWSIRHLNKKYGYLQVLGLCLVILGVIKKNPFGKNADRLICNELVILFLNDFTDFEMSDDSDNYNLNTTYDLVKEYSK